MKSLVIGMGTLALAAGIAHADPKDYLYQRALRAQEKNLPETLVNGLRSLFSLVDLNASSVTADTFDQRVNPEDPKDLSTFKQRYFINSKFAKDSTSPVLFYVCGEAACDDSEFFGEFAEQAEKYAAHMVALEHRYYGQSQPFSDLSAAHMKFLTVDNALKDLATFQAYAMSKFQLNGKWVSVGGSYPGALSAYYRLKYPALVAGALASSAPVHSKADFEEYDLDVSEVAGADCGVAMRKVVAQVEATLNKPDELAQVKTLFGADTVRDPVDFLYVIADMGAIAVQYGHRDEFCGAVLGGDPLQGYATAGKKMFAWFGITAEQDSLQGAESEDVSLYNTSLGMRQWFYQSCQDFGFFQIAFHDPEVSVRSPKITLQYHYDACKRMFGLDPVDTNRLNNSAYQPILNPSTSNILFTNGSTDPWSKLSVTHELGNDTNPNTATYTIQGGSHCTDMGASSSKDLPPVTTARQKFSDLLAVWFH